MKKKSRANLIGLTGFAAIVGLISFWQSTNNSPAIDESKLNLVGEMRYFVPARSVIKPPNISWVNGSGKPVFLSDFSGKVTLLNYWATWCAPCLEELPSLNNLQLKLGGDDFSVVALNVDRGGKPVADKMKKQLKIDALPLQLDPTLTSYDALGVQVMPTTFLFDRKGNILGVFRGGAKWDSPEAVALIKYFVGRPNYTDGLSRPSSVPSSNGIEGTASVPNANN